MPEETKEQEQVQEPVQETKKEQLDLLEEEPVYRAPEPAEEAAPEEPAEDTSGWRSDQVAFGRSVGLSEEEVRSFDSPEVFDRVVGKFMSAYQGHHDALSQQQAAMQQQAAIQHNQQRQAQQPKGYTFENPDEYDEELVKMNTHYGERVSNLESYLGHILQSNQNMQQTNQQMQMALAEQQFESIVNTMDEDMYGRGVLNDVTEDAQRHRFELSQEVARQADGFTSRGEVMPSLLELSERAHNALHGSSIKSKALEQAAEKSQKRASQSVARPTSQEEAPLSGKDAAIQAAAEWHREHGTVSGYDDQGFI